MWVRDRSLRSLRSDALRQNENKKIESVRFFGPALYANVIYGLMIKRFEFDDFANSSIIESSMN